MDVTPVVDKKALPGQVFETDGIQLLVCFELWQVAEPVLDQVIVSELLKEAFGNRTLTCSAECRNVPGIVSSEPNPVEAFRI
jgi:hypothetical protein